MKHVYHVLHRGTVICTQGARRKHNGPDTCDYIYARMVYHMIPVDTARAYVAQMAAALKQDQLHSRIFITDHDSNNGGHTRGTAELVLEPYGPMAVVPLAVELNEFLAGGHLKLERVVREWPFFGDAARYKGSADEMGFGHVWSRATIGGGNGSRC